MPQPVASRTTSSWPARSAAGSAASTAAPARGHARRVLERLEEPLDPRHAGRGPADRPAAARRDRPGAVAGRPHPDHGRADLGAERGRGRGAVQGDPRADAARRRDRLHLPPPRGGARRSPTTSPCCATASSSRRGRAAERRPRLDRRSRWSVATPGRLSPSATPRARRRSCSRVRRAQRRRPRQPARLAVDDVSLDGARRRDRRHLRPDGRRAHRAARGASPGRHAPCDRRRSASTARRSQGDTSASASRAGWRWCPRTASATAWSRSLSVGQQPVAGQPARVRPRLSHHRGDAERQRGRRR